MKKVKVMSLLLALVLLAGCMSACDGKTEPSSSPQPSNNEQGSSEAVDSSETEEADEDAARRGGVMQYTFKQLSPTYDPYGQASWTTFIWAQNIFESVLVRGADGVVYPLLCDYELSDDGLTLKLWLRDNVTFSDGTPVTLDDVIASLKRAALFTPKVNTALWDVVKKYDIKDSILTFEFTEFKMDTFDVFCQPRPCYGSVMPKSICEKYGDKLIDNPADCIGTGPYKLIASESSAGSVYAMERNENYSHNIDGPDDNGYASPRKQYLDKLYCIKNDDANSTLMCLLSGELDVVDYTNDEAFVNTLEPLGYQEACFSAGTALYMFYNCSANRIVSDVNLRKAIACCTNSDDICFAGIGKNADLTVDGPLMLGSNYSNTPISSQDYAAREEDLELAREYLKKSKYNGEKITICTNYPGSVPVLVEMLQAIGLNVESVGLDNATLQAYAKDPAQDWDIIFRGNPYGYTLPSGIDTTFYETLFNDRASELAQLLKTVPANSEKSKAYYQEFAQIVGDECAFKIFGGTVDYYNVVPGLNLNRTGAWRYFFNAYWDDPAAHMK